MRARLDSLLPPSSSSEPAALGAQLVRAVLVRSNFIPGVRHRLGWRGVAACPGDPGCYTARVDGRRGVFGMAPAAVGPGEAWAVAHLFYFPHPDEDLADAFSVQAGILVQAEGYIDRVRDFPTHPEFATLFQVGAIEAACDRGAPAAALALAAPERHTVRALDGVRVDTPQGPVQVVEPGGEDQDLPCMVAAMPFMRTLAASAAYCLGSPPDSLELRSRSLPRFVYDAQGLSGTEPWDDGAELRLALGFGAGDAMLAPPPDMGAWPRAPRIRWRAPAPVPEAYADEPWWSADVPGAAHSLDKNAMGIAEPPRLIVLTGFLGAGKTSFLTRFIEQQAARNAFTAVIQNEIGAKGLDGQLLGQRYAVTEMDEGCVCCSLAGNLRPALAQILGTFQPDFVVLETTGLANPANILDELADIGDQAAFGSVTTVVDAPLARKTLEAHEVARSQARLADIILLNKTDLVAPDELDAIEQRLRALNPVAPIHRCTHGDIPATALYGVNMRPVRRAHLPTMDTAPHAHHHHHNHATHASDGIASIVLDATAPIHRDAFLEWIDALPPSILRAKGVLDFKDQDEPQLIQYVPGHLDLAPAGEADSGERFLVVIGNGAEVDAAAKNAPLP